MKHGTMNMKLFRAKLREVADKKGISISRIAERAGMMTTQLYRVERGGCGLSDDNIRKIAKAVKEDPLKWLRLAWLDRMPEDVRKMFLRR